MAHRRWPGRTRASLKISSGPAQGAVLPPGCQHRARTHIHARTHARTRTHAHARTHTHARTRTHTYTHRHTHTQTHVVLPPSWIDQLAPARRLGLSSAHPAQILSRQLSTSLLSHVAHVSLLWSLSPLIILLSSLFSPPSFLSSVPRTSRRPLIGANLPVHDGARATARAIARAESRYKPTATHLRFPHAPFGQNRLFRALRAAAGVSPAHLRQSSRRSRRTRTCRAGRAARPE
jgi:hypothetical protein